MSKLEEMLQLANEIANEGVPKKKKPSKKGVANVKKQSQDIVAKIHEQPKEKKPIQSVKGLLVCTIGKDLCNVDKVNNYLGTYVSDYLVRFKSINTDTSENTRGKVVLKGISLTGKTMRLEFTKVNNQLSFDLYHDGKLVKSAMVDRFNDWADNR